MKNRLPAATILLALLGFLFAGLIVARVNAAKPTPTVPIPPPRKPFPTGIGATGIIESRHENIRIGTPQPGLVTQVFVKVWDAVQPGTPLFALDSSELRAQLPAQQAEIRVRRAQLEDCTDRLRRMERLDRASVATAQEVENARNETAIATAQLAAAEARADEIQLLIERLTVRAPSAGTVLQLNTRAGEYLTPAATDPPVILGNIEEVQVRADVDEQVAPRIRAGARAVGFIKGDASRSIPLEFVRIEPYVVPKRSLTGSGAERVDTRVLQIIYRFPRPADAQIYVGQQMDLFIDSAPTPATSSTP